MQGPSRLVSALIRRQAEGCGAGIPGISTFPLIRSLPDLSSSITHIPFGSSWGSASALVGGLLFV